MVQNRRYLLRLYITDHHRIFWDQTPTYFLFVNKRRNQSPDLPPFSVDDRPHLCMRQSCVPQKSNQNLLSRLQLMLHSHYAIWDIAPSPSSKRIFKSRAATKACLAPAGRRFRQSLSLEFVFLMIKVSWCFFFKPMSPSFLYPTNKYDIATMARVTATRQATQGQGRLLFAHGNYLRSNLRSQTPGDHLNCRGSSADLHWKMT